MGGLPFRLCLFFAANPDEYLLTADVAEKFNKPRGDVDTYLRPLVDNGWLAKEGGKAGGNSCRQTQSKFKAGPLLLAAIGH